MTRRDLCMRKRYGVFACYHCHQLQYCNMLQKTHRCVNCGKNLSLPKVNPIFKTDKIDEAIQLIQEMKKREGLRKGWGKFITADKLRTRVK